MIFQTYLKGHIHGHAWFDGVVTDVYYTSYNYGDRTVSSWDSESDKIFWVQIPTKYADFSTASSQ